MKIVEVSISKYERMALMAVRSIFNLQIILDLKSYLSIIQLTTTVAERGDLVKSKFNVDSNKEKRTFDGIVFDSIMELKYYKDVILPAYERGDIVHFERQMPYILQPSFLYNCKKIRAIIYKADFYIEYSDGRTVVIDIKGHADSVALLKRKLFWYAYPDTNYVWLTLYKGEWIPWDEKKKSKKLQKGEDNNGKEEKGREVNGEGN